MNACVITEKSVSGEEKPLLKNGLRQKPGRSRRKKAEDGGFDLSVEPGVC